MGQIITTKLIPASAPPGPDASIAVAEDGATLELQVPPGRELIDAALTIVLPDDAITLDLLAGATLATSAGPGPADSKTVAWISVDWRARRGLVGLELRLKAGTTATHLRLRLSDGGPWVLATPVALTAITVNADPTTGATAIVQLPGLAASRVLIELTKKIGTPLGPEDYALADGVITGLTLRGARRPPTLTVSVAPAAIVHHEPALLPPAAALTVRGPLLAALRAALPGRAGGTASVVLRSPAPAALHALKLALTSRSEVTLWRESVAPPRIPGAPTPELELGLLPARDTVAVIALADHPTRFSAQVQATLRPELPPVVATPPATRYAHRCTPSSALAQSFGFPDAGALVGLDLLLAARGPELRGRVDLHRDEHGAPADPPLASIELLETGPQETPGAPRWRCLDLAEPLVFPAATTLWVSLQLAAGEARWSLAPRPGDPVGALLRRDLGEAWVARDMSFPAGPQAPWAVSRPRLRNDGAPLPLTLLLRRGAASLPLLADADGRVAADAAALAPLRSAAADAPLELVVRCPSAGRVRLSALRVEQPPQTDLVTLGNKP